METSGKKVIELNIEDVLPNRFQPRIKFNEEAINELSKSIKEHGVIQPIVVRPIGDKFEIIAGERRYKASCMADLKTIPAIITDLNDKDSAEVALIENVQRENLTPIEEAISYKKILDMGYITQDALATKLGKTQSTVANKLRLLNLDDEVQEALLEEKISERHARSLLKLQNPSQQREMLNKIITERLTVRRADEEIEKMINNVEETKTNKEEIKEEPNQFFKFINVPTQEEIKEEPKNEEIQPEEQKNEEIEPELEELKPGKFFNILSTEEQEEKEPETKEDEEQPKFNFESIFTNPIDEPKMRDNNALLEELNEIEKSINNSNELPPIFSEKPIESEPKAEPQETTEQNISEEQIDFIDDDFEDEFEDEKLTEEIKTEQQEKEESIKQPIIQLQTSEINNFKDVLQTIRDCSEKIERAGYVIDTEEYDLDNTYQVIFKIEKPEK